LFAQRLVSPYGRRAWTTTSSLLTDRLE